MATPDFGRRLLPSLVDELALVDPDRIMYSFAKTANPADGFQDIRPKTLARAINRCAWYIEETLGRGRDFPTLAYMGPQDVMYGILILACIKTGYKLLLNSPRNALEAHLSLFEETGCHVFLLPPRFRLPVVQQILSAREMRVLDIPDARQWLSDTYDGLERTYPFTKTFEQARYEPFVVLHTSGSTGHPKSVVVAHGTISTLDAYQVLDPPCFPGTVDPGSRFYICAPLFHQAGLGLFLASIYRGFTAVLGPFPPSADVVDAMHVHGRLEYSTLLPTSLIELATSPEHLANLARMKWVLFGGGSVPKAVGDLVSTKMRMINGFGSTECGMLPTVPCDAEDWACLRFHPALGAEFRPVGSSAQDGEELFEQVLVRDPKLDLYQGVFSTFPELKEWPMRDMYSKHPLKEGVWIYRGRTDDIIVYSTGEKFNPVEMEATIASLPTVRTALVYGTGRFQSSLLVEPAQPLANEAEKEAAREAIWPTVQAANVLSPYHSRIHRHMISFTLPDKPLPRAAKGSVQRKLSFNLYAAELDGLYKSTEQAQANHYIEMDNVEGNESFSEAIKRIVTASTNDIDVQALGPGENLFELGLDSLQITLITRGINQFLAARGRPPTFANRIVYASPSLGALTNAVKAAAEEKNNHDAQNGSTESDEQKMQRLYELNVVDLPNLATKVSETPEDGEVVLLTGSTGSLGAYILDTLLSEPRVRFVYCLNRTHPGNNTNNMQRQTESQAAKGLKALRMDKVEFLDTASLAQPTLGLPQESYDRLIGNVTLVIHNAWQVDFNQPLDAFVGQVAGVRKLVDLVASSRHQARLFFISSVSAVAEYGRDRAGIDAEGGDGILLVPEQIYEHFHLPKQHMGYGQAKFVAERVLAAAGGNTIVCRLGQIAGPTTPLGMWPRQEWVPSMIASSKAMGKLPSSLGVVDAVDWVPVDAAARAVVELALLPRDEDRRVYHVANPRRTRWSELVPVVKRFLGEEREVELVSLEQWVAALRRSAAGMEDVMQNPAVKILDFFEDLVNSTGSGSRQVMLATKEADAKIAALTGLEPVGQTWMENWMRQWAF